MHGWTTDSELLFENETWYLLLYNQLKGEIWQKLQRNFFIFSGKYSHNNTHALPHQHNRGSIPSDICGEGDRCACAGTCEAKSY